MKKEKKETKNEREKKHSRVKIMIINQGRSFSVWIEGAKKMLLCLPATVRVLLDKEVLCISGRELSCLSYGTGAIEIVGTLYQISFEDAKEGR